MGSNICMNEGCRVTTSSEWKKGWSLKSGGFAILCYSCGSAYENSVFCETFHSKESGWRECTVCRKRIHCGCIASRYLHEYMDFGGIACISCAKRLEIRLVQSMQIPGDILNGTVVTNGNPIVNENQIGDSHVSFGGLLRLAKAMETDVVSSGLDRVKVDKPMPKTGDQNKRFPNLAQQCSSSAFVKSDNIRPIQGVKDTNESPPQPPINFSLTSSLLPFPGRNVEGITEQNKGSFQKEQRSRNILPKPPKPSPTVGTEANNNGTVSQVRVARPPAEGRGRNQLLPRYWPRITDQELQQLSGELKSTIVPLFEKILSASDAGRIGRLVLPKACAEAYFPHITQSEGIPIRIQDIKGKEWTFQFRFWPNNNSRMYVLEGVTPCIQNMQLEAGDTVTFSKIVPGGQLVVGGRKATNNGDVQDSQAPSIPNGDSTGETSFSGVTDNMVTNGGRTSDDSSMQRNMSIPEKKKLRNIKNKRLLMNTDEAMELQITWEEAQELFRPSPTSEPTIVMVEDHEFEEFEEPPIFGKKTVFTSRPSGEQEQLAQCDSCSKWRRLPLNALLSAKWTCSENIWDPKRSSCSAPEDINPRDLESFFSINKDSKKQRFSDNKTSNEGEPCGLDALATAAVLGDNIVELGESSVGATTRHPRHRPGCTCIVCIQPPSGKGKHEPSCKCNVCLTVRRRFKTLMMRKKKRQSEREAELALGKEKVPEDIAGQALLSINPLENEVNYNGAQIELEESSNGGQLDLNCDPHKEDDLLAAAAGMSLTSLMNAATLPLDMYLRPCIISRNAVDSEEKVGGLVCGDVGKENDRGDG